MSIAEPGHDVVDVAEAARQLGVKQATLYSYVSRGVLTRRRASGGGVASSGSGGGRGGPGRGSLFDDVDTPRARGFVFRGDQVVLMGSGGRT